MNSKAYICKFCGKHKDDVKKLIQGNGCAICNECVKLANDICDERAKIQPEGVTGSECWVPITNGEYIAFPKASVEPNGVTYIRWVDERGVEIMYYDSEEWREDPKTTMGAILGALLNGAGWEEYPRRNQKT